MGIKEYFFNNKGITFNNITTTPIITFFVINSTTILSPN